MKALFTLLLSFLITTTLQAQLLEEAPAPFQPNFQAGIKGGVNISSVTNLGSGEPFLGFHAGVFGNRLVSESVGFGAELNYSRQGVSSKTLDVGLNYLTVPVLVSYYDGHATFQAGVYGAMLVKADSRVGMEKEKITSLFEKNDFGFVVGLNYSPTGATFFGARFNLGLMNINRHLTALKQPELNNRNLQLLAGYTF